MIFFVRFSPGLAHQRQKAGQKSCFFFFLSLVDPYAHQTRHLAQSATVHGFAFAARRSASLFARRRASKYSPQRNSHIRPCNTPGHQKQPNPIPDWVVFLFLVTRTRNLTQRRMSHGFAYPTRRSESSLSRRRVWVYSSLMKFTTNRTF